MWLTNANQITSGKVYLCRNEKSLPGLSQLNCWTNRQRTPLRDWDHSRNGPQLVPSLQSNCPRMYPERFRRMFVPVGSREIRLTWTQHPKCGTPSCWIVGTAFYWPWLQFLQKPVWCIPRCFQERIYWTNWLTYVLEEGFYRSIYSYDWFTQRSFKRAILHITLLDPFLP